LYRAKRYHLRNEAAKRFFAEFSKDPSRREAILREQAARRAARRNLVDPFVTEGVVPKPESVEEGIIGLPEYVYLIPDASSGGLWLRRPSQSERPRTDCDPVFGAGRMPTDNKLRQMALDIIDTAFLRLIDEICEDVLNED
jgi:hypothetical protein